jgi:prophage regulatory protein
MNARILRLPLVLKRTGLSRSMIYLLIQEGRFPHQIQLTVRSVGWLESDVDEWLEQKITACHRVVS